MLAITFVSNIEELQSRADKLDDPEAELEDACEHVAELALSMLQPGASESSARTSLKTYLIVLMSEWFGSDDRLLRILESEEAQAIAYTMGPQVVQEVSGHVVTAAF